MTAHQTYFEIIGVISLIFWFISLLFASTIIIVIVSHWRTQCRSITNLLTCNSCVALIFYDLAVLLQIPWSIQRAYFDLPEPNPLVCQIFACLGMVGTSTMSISFLIQAMSRFFITILSKHKFLLTFRTNWIMIISSWINSAIVAGGMLISPLAYQYEPESHLCTLTTTHFPTSLMPSIFLVMSMITMLILYGIILYHTVRHTRLNPNSASTLRAERNKKVFKRICLFAGIFGFGGTPYCVCTILNRVSRVPWPLYSLTFLWISFAAAINSIALLVTNHQVKELLLTKLTKRQTNLLRHTITHRRNQTVSHGNQMNTLQPMTTIC